jgi:hypothetical protein
VAAERQEMSLDRVRQKLDEQIRKIQYGAQPGNYGRDFWYVLGFTKGKGRKVFWGPMQEEDAMRALNELNEGEFFKLKTKDPHRAVREVRDILIKRGESPDEALKKLLHKREVEEKPRGLISRLFRGRTQPRGLRGISRATPPPKSIMREDSEE